MKHLFTSFVFLFFVYNVFSQVPDAFNYQAAVRNNSGEIIANTNVSFRISILQETESGTAVYVETHSAQTNAFGLVNLKIGQGILVSGVFDPASWGGTLHFIKIEMDVEGGNNFVHLGTSQLLSVPYAFHAKTVEIDNVDDADADPQNEIQTLALAGSELSLSNGGGSVTLPLGEGGDNWGTQTVNSDATLDGDGTASNPLSVVGDLTDDQTLSLSGTDLSILDGNTVSLSSLSSPWETAASGIKFTGGVVAINQEPYLTEGKLQIDGAGGMAINIRNNAGQPTISAYNWMEGQLSAAFGKIMITDGTEGDGKVLTSDNLGKASWQTPKESPWTESGSDVYYLGRVGIGTASPYFKLNVNGSAGNAYASFQNNATGNTSNDGLVIGAQSGSGNSYIWNYETSNLIFGTSNASAMSIASSGDVSVSNNLIVGKEVYNADTGSNNLLPFAYGYVTSAGTLSSGTSNIDSASKASTGQYKVNITGLGSDYIVMVTPNQPTAFLTGVVTARGTTSITVAIWDTKNDAYYDGGFSFVIYKP